MSDPLRAVIWVIIGGDEAGQLASCAQWCAVRGYQIAAILRGAWSEVWAMLDSGQADIAVVRSRRDIPEPRMPRLEIVADEQVPVAAPTPLGLITGRGPARGQARRTRRIQVDDRH